jgi:hypothetical protein
MNKMKCICFEADIEKCPSECVGSPIREDKGIFSYQFGDGPCKKCIHCTFRDIDVYIIPYQEYKIDINKDLPTDIWSI